MFMLGSLVSLILLVWMVARVWKQSALLAVASIFLWPVLIVALFKYWGDDESDIRVPFFIFAPVFIFTWYQMNQMSNALTEQKESLLSMLLFFA